jgi:hypothetical protein
MSETGKGREGKGRERKGRNPIHGTWKCYGASEMLRNLPKIAQMVMSKGRK